MGNKNISFNKPKSLMEAYKYVQQTVNEASKIKLHVTWGFDEQQADPFHHNFSDEEFIRCLKTVINNLDPNLLYHK